MSRTRWLAALAFVLMLAGVAGAAAWRPSVHLAASLPPLELESAFPRQFGAWRMDERGPVQLVSPDQAALLDKIYSQTLSRIYVGPQGARIMLSVAYGGDQSDATRAHRPEVCYPAQGFNIGGVAERVLDLSGVPLRTRQLVGRQGGRIEPITYWILVGDKPILGGPEQKYTQLSYTLRGVIPDGMLVRVSSIDADTAAAFELHRRFLEDLLAGMDDASRRRVIGELAARFPVRSAKAGAGARPGA